MKFLTDVNASGALAQWLRDMGHDVAQVADRDARLTDDAILQWAVQEQRIIVTTDTDFEEMIWRKGEHHFGLLRLENLPRVGRKALLEDVLANHSKDLTSGYVVIAQTKKIRIRRPFRIFRNQ
jgi:predicted nuclease of predicted toxin-antitoxin system